ncbi:GIY-YIG nuclease family protein [Actinoplanes couchii]|nr:GIY-YIG nuclease family protein [Actinoplanes couchii]MDR6317932.1 hypothetical protein [Actinoplanes couchii]
MTDPDYPPYDPHNIPGVYFVYAYPPRRPPNGDPEHFKIGQSGDPNTRLPAFRNGNPAYMVVRHVIYQPDAAARRALETTEQNRFRHLDLGHEWFEWRPEVEDYVAGLCAQRCIGY